MAHRRAKLTPFGRLLLVQRIEELGWSVSQAAESLGVSRTCAHRWLARYRTEGEAGLEDRSSRPRSSPTTLSEQEETAILKARRELRQGPHRLASLFGRPRSTIYAVLR